MYGNFPFPISKMTQDLDIIIIPLTRLNKYKQFVVNHEWEWTFFGTDACLRENVIKKLGEGNRYYYAEELSDITIKNKKPFLDWIAEIGKKQEQPFWWGTNIAYKNPLSTDLFLNICLLTLLKEWIDKGVKKRLVIVEHPPLLKACANNLDSPAILIEKSVANCIGYTLKTVFFSWTRMLLFLIRYLNMWLLNKWFGVNYKKKLRDLFKSSPSILMYTWVEDRSFADGHFTDIYLGKLKTFYETKGLRTVFVISPEIPPRFMDKIYRSGEIIPTLLFISLADIISSFFHSVSFKWAKALPDFCGFDLHPVFENEKIKEKGKLCYYIALYYGFYNFFKETDINCKAIIYPFENQPWDKMAIMGMQKAESSSKMIAYQHTVVPCFLLNYFLGENEKGIHPEPDIIVANGDTWARVLKKSGFTCPIYNGGSLRYSKSEKKEGDVRNDKKEQSILVLFSPVLSYTLDLIFYLKRRPWGDKKFLLKPHPDMPEKIVRKYAGTLPDNFIFIKGPLDEWFDKVGWAIHVGTTAAIECLMNGITVYKYIPERIDVDPFFGMNLPQRIVTESDSLTFEHSKSVIRPDPDIIDEEFHEAVWNQVVQ
ncbi:MAG: hypothetical protein ABIJ37_02435 [Pseudomonadota bacterium]